MPVPLCSALVWTLPSRVCLLQLAGGKVEKEVSEDPEAAAAAGGLAGKKEEEENEESSKLLRFKFRRGSKSAAPMRPGRLDARCRSQGRNWPRLKDG
ncbi:uncharacterized protein CLUP02_02772 [Colletotrichum lupini]|uniref:Uncharacterized protein n=1 Tax=Colletotrichum lupini TaxID=145971 RepID=A0A9Q8SHZ0_9PEZI|nr:uncharacterized protein CLUP02_02772 [Colletotrichum lupini]UQC77305.1 hypothetical protein CLUP02_02772 [Colletotrichum lupini]